WAETARDLASAAAAEKMAEDRKHQAIQARAQLQRTKALVEEGIARLGRLRAELDAASSPVRHAPSAATPGAVSPGAASARPVSLPPAAPVPAASPPAPGAPAPSTPVAPKSGAKP
ncbi:MAG TPA: hypothetical protein VHV30_01900, partial [Polyangiaceae bacterium]|nr:hypothetical protein [Polyangiaceae bacterium]